MGKRWIGVFLVVAMIAGLIAGCGGSDSSSTAATDGGSSTGDGGSTLSKAEFIKQADALCAKNNTTMAKEAETFTPSSGAKPAEVEEELVTEIYAPGIGNQAEEIASLGAPSGDEEEVEAIVEAIEAGTETAEEDPSTFAQGAFAESTKLARAYGFEVCGGE